MSACFVTDMGTAVALSAIFIKPNVWFPVFIAGSIASIVALPKLTMSTGLTIGTIRSLYGLDAHIIDRTQFSLLLTVVVVSAIVPTMIAHHWFSPDVAREAAADATSAAAEGARTQPARQVVKVAHAV